jgi:putative hydrolase of the HAD superfamily
MREQYEVFGAVELDALEQTYIRLIDQTHSKVLAGTLDLDRARGERFRLMFAEYGVMVNNDQAMIAADAYRAAYVEHRQPVPGAIELLKVLRPQVKIGIITNHIREEQHRKINDCNLWPYFDELIISGDIGIIKPNAGIFEHAMGLFSVQAKDCVMVGDSWHSDITGAYGVGMPAVWLNRYDDPFPDPAMATMITSFEPTESVTQLLLA